MNQGRKLFAPETAVGTGAAEPLVDEVEAAKEVPSVDESTAGKGKNQPGNEGDSSDVVKYSGDDTADAGNSEVSTGEDYETRHADDDTLAGAAVDPDVDEAEVNKPVEETRPEAPQALRRRKRVENPAKQDNV